MNPIATFTMQSKEKIVVELLPELAPNTVKSFISLALKGCYNNHSIQRIVPGSWIDLSYSAFGKDYAKYFIDNEAITQDNRMISYGMMCMGGYGANEIAGGEVFFPLRDCPDLVGKYPILGTILEGAELLRSFEVVPTRPIKLEKSPTVEINEPLDPIIIESVTIETFETKYEEPMTKKPLEYPEKW